MVFLFLILFTPLWSARNSTLPSTDQLMANDSGAPSWQPTKLPTDIPTPSPTESPSLPPTVPPTEPPTPSSTYSPTLTPTSSPTQPPSIPIPTESPTDSSTESPTNIPSTNPTSVSTDLPTPVPTSSHKSIGSDLANIWYLIVIAVVVGPFLVCLLIKFCILKNCSPLIENPDLAYMQMEEFEEANASLNEASSVKRPLSFERMGDKMTYSPIDELTEF